MNEIMEGYWKQKYFDAVGRAKKEINDLKTSFISPYSCIGVKQTIENIFPELALEDDDEKAVKAINCAISISGITEDEAKIARKWVDKQLKKTNRNLDTKYITDTPVIPPGKLYHFQPEEVKDKEFKLDIKYFWGDYDSEMLNRVIDRYEEYLGKKKIPPIDALREQNWLRCLRILTTKLRPDWKPSDEQLKALKNAIAYFGKEWGDKTEQSLREIYDNIKTL